ncbi:hypothetical protein PINS_up012234 [Pythium insidiosum]|nr:hypothetical protein PINS_up012234 [Pythium insidiosum]
MQPFICICTIFDNAIMATTGLQDRSRAAVRAMLAFHACVVPLILVVCYELAYLVHKQKSVNFCGISFESGHRRILGRNALSTCQRFAVWLVGLALLVLNLFAAYRWSDEDVEIRSLYDLHGDSTTHAVLSVLPALVLVALSLYIGLQLWNYGTFYSYMVHATCFNPWIWMLVGSVSLLAGYLMPTSVYALTSNAGELVMLATIVRMFREVHHDMQQGQQMRSFIDPLPTVSPQSQSRSGGLSVPDSAGKYSPLSLSGASAVHVAVGGAAAAAFLEVHTPKQTTELHMEPPELSSTHAHCLPLVSSGSRPAETSPSSMFSSLVVSSTRTNPLFND